MSGTIVLSYHDSLIHESDVELLTGPHWLNDTLIGFYLEYLEEEVLGGLDVSLVRPEITQCLKMSPVSEYPIFLDPLEFRRKSFAVLPLNDCERAEAAGGSHWSLLVYSRPESSFFHIDSSHGANHHHAKLLSSKLSNYLRQNLELTPIKSLQQTNSYDCGVFVLCNIDNVIKQIGKCNKVTEFQPITEVQVLRKRQDLKQLIENLSRN